jgi:hypothetical protein
MNRLLWSVPMVLCGLLLTTANAQLIKPPDHKAEAPSPSIAYVPHQGQFADVNGEVIEDLLYAAYGHGVKLYVRENCMFSYVGTQHVPDSIGPDTTLRLDVQLVGELVNYDPQVAHDEETEWYHNYYLAHCTQGITGVHGYKVVALYDVYPGINMYLYSNKWGYKIYLEVQPGADPTNIALKFEGQDDLQIAYLGALEAVFGNKELKIPQAIAYQLIGGTTVPVPGWPEYDVNNNTGIVNFNFEPYDTDYPLILDISESLGAAGGGGGGQVPEWGTYYGGGESERVLGMTAMEIGGIATCGETASPLFPANAGAFYANSITDAYVSYFNEDYERVLTMFFGGDSFDWLQGVADMGSDGLAVVGQTMSDPLTIDWTAPLGYYADNTKGANARNCILLQLDTAGTIGWNSLYGPDNSLEPSAIAVDANKNIVIGGTAEWDFGPSDTTAYPVAFTNGPTNGQFPITGGGYSQSQFGRKQWQPLWTNPNYWHDGWLARFENGDLVWSTLFGGSANWDYIEDITIEQSSGEIFVVGHTLSPASLNVPACEAPPTDTIGFPWCQAAGAYWQTPIAPGVHFEGEMMAFVAQFDPSSFDLLWCTPFGALGGSETFATACAIQTDRDLVVTGFTYDCDYYSTVPGQPDTLALPAANTSNPYQGTNNSAGMVAGSEGFIAEFAASTRELTWMSFLSQLPTDIACGNGRTSVAGDRFAVTPLQVSSDLYSDNNVNSEGGICIMTFDDQGLVHSTAWGGDGTDVDGLVALTQTDDRIYVAHNTSSILNSPYHCPNVPPPAVPWCVDLNSGLQDVFYGQLLRQWPEVGIAEGTGYTAGPVLLVYPNPAEDIATLIVPDHVRMLHVYNGLGQVIARAQRGSGATLRLSTETWAEGCYHITAVDGAGSVVGRAKVFVVR